MNSFLNLLTIPPPVPIALGSYQDSAIQYEGKDVDILREYSKRLKK